MSLQEIADKLVTYCRAGQFEEAQKELFAEDAVSIEPMATEAFAKETKGLQAIIEKGEKFESMVAEYHQLEISAPLLADNSFVISLHMDVTMKEKGRMDMRELCVYVVKNGKIVSEQFFM